MKHLHSHNWIRALRENIARKIMFARLIVVTRNYKMLKNHIIHCCWKIFGSVPAYLYYLTHKKNSFDYELAIVAVMKNEGPYLQEWIEYHKLVGVQKFYLYDNESTDDTKKILEPYIASGEVVYHLTPGSMKDFILPNYIYTDAIKKYRNEARWIAVIDLDEFIVPLTCQTIPQVLDDIQKTSMKGKLFTSLGIHWVVYGYSGHYNKPEGLVIENYTMSAGPNRFIKSIINPRTVIRFESPHYALHFFYKGGVNENGKPIKDRLFNNDVSNNDIQKIRVNHYRTKSYEEFKTRLERNKKEIGSIYITERDMPPMDLNDINWLKFNYMNAPPNIPDMVMEKYIPILKYKIAI